MVQKPWYVKKPFGTSKKSWYVKKTKVLSSTSSSSSWSDVILSLFDPGTDCVNQPEVGRARRYYVNSSLLRRA
jgi:hypothetical protein